MWFVYIIECSDLTLYTGITNDIEKRLKAHNTGKACRYTAYRFPVKLRALFETTDRSAASKEEYRIKQLTKQQKIKLFNI